MSRSTVQRATLVPSRSFSCRQTLRGPVDPEVLFPDPPDVSREILVASLPCRPPRRVEPAGSVRVVRRGGDRQLRADRLDPEDVAMFVHEGHHHFTRRSSSAWAKYADAFRRISFARLRSRFSRSSSLRRWRSSVVRPGRRPVSRSLCRTHRRSVSAVQPNFSEIEQIALHCDLSSLSCSYTIRTARSRTSGEYLLARDMGSILSTNGPSGIPGAVQYRSATHTRSAVRRAGTRPTEPLPTHPRTSRPAIR